MRTETVDVEIGLVGSAGSTDTSETTVEENASAAERDITPAYFLTKKSIKGLIVDESNCFWSVYFTFRFLFSFLLVCFCRLLFNCGMLFKLALAQRSVRRVCSTRLWDTKSASHNWLNSNCLTTFEERL